MNVTHPAEHTLPNEWTAVICDENRRHAYLDYPSAHDVALFADDRFFVQIARHSALPQMEDGKLLAQGSWIAEDVVHEFECPLIDDVAPDLSLLACFERAQIMAAALNAAEKATAGR